MLGSFGPLTLTVIPKAQMDKPYYLLFCKCAVFFSSLFCFASRMLEYGSVTGLDLKTVSYELDVHILRERRLVASESFSDLEKLLLLLITN